ncbi:MAG: hypothetical protein Q9191_002752 [Dirinaria sp. TL-2023a]
MPRHRTVPAEPPPNARLGESWVVEEEPDSAYEPTSSSSSAESHENLAATEISSRSRSNAQEQPKDQTPRTSPRQRQDSLERVLKLPRRSSRASTRVSVEPELIMPSIHQDSVGGSWLGEEKPRKRTGTKKGRQDYAGRPQQGIAREHQPNGSGSQDLLAEALQNALSFLLPIWRWLFDVAGGALTALKKPISYFLAIYLFFGILIVLRNFLTNSISTAISPICRIPGSSLLIPLCQTRFPTPTSSSSEESPPVQFDELMTVQSKFEDVLAASASGVSLPLDMKRGETSIRDLRTVVRHSTLQSKNELVYEFDGFIATARMASTDLQKFNSHVGRGVDNLLATARWTKRVLDGIAEQKANAGTLTTFISDKILAPFQPMVKVTETALLEQYMQHTRIVESEISRLVLEAQALLGTLTNLEDRLDVMHGIATRDDLRAQTSKQELLADLWTVLGGNRSKLGKFNAQIALLRQVNGYRRTAYAHVSGTMLKLQAMGAELEELRERVGGVELLGAVPLAVHIENIELGVERLERGRGRARELEGETMRRATTATSSTGAGGGVVGIEGR